MESVVDFLRSYPGVPALGLLVLGVTGWHLWHYEVRPRLIPKQEEVDDGASFTEITLDVREERNTGLGAL